MAKDKKQLIDDNNYKLSLLNYNKKELIRAKKESMLKTLNMLKL